MWFRRNRRRAERRRVQLPTISWARVAAATASVAMVVGAYVGVLWLLNRPIETLVVEGEFQRVTPLQVESLVERRARTGFLNVDLHAIRREIQALPWVAGADVRRRWPHTLRVRVREQVPVARWGDDGLLNATGELFLTRVERLPAELPLLRGPAGTEMEVTRRYFYLQRELEQRGMVAAGLALDARGAWNLRLSNGIEVRLGARGVDERIARFLQVLDRMLVQVTADVAYIDMRYPNGFAVGWKDRDAARAAIRKGPEPNV